MAVFIESDNIISSLGFSSDLNFNNILQEQTGLLVCNDPYLSDETLPLSRVDDTTLNEAFNQISDGSRYTRFEKLMLLSAHSAIKQSKVDITSDRTVFILSTTKGNIELLQEGNTQEITQERLYLWNTADLLRRFFGNPNNTVTVSNACISGVVALVMGKRLIDSGQYDNAVVVGVDVISKFVVSGFQSFHSLSAKPCRPFDKERDGLSLGEGAATAILTNNDQLLEGPKIEVVNGASSNDANHISGPSRTGEGLLIAINNTILEKYPVDIISAHGTATPYNDDMESKGIFRAGLGGVPVNSLKGYFGHTLGAAGIIESLIGIYCLKENVSVKTLGYSNFGVAEKICIADRTEKKELKTLLKLASGFGGCNAAALFVKHD